jgi:hypothetical protein
MAGVTPKFKPQGRWLSFCADTQIAIAANEKYRLRARRSLRHSCFFRADQLHVVGLGRAVHQFAKLGEHRLRPLALTVGGNGRSIQCAVT